MEQLTFSLLWEIEGKMVRNGQLSITEGEKIVKKRCDDFCEKLRKSHLKYVRSMSYQTREHWGFCDHCELTAKCWIVSW